MTDDKPKRGFAALDPEKRKQLAAKGGRALHDQGKAHALTEEEARRGGKSGGRAVAQDVEHMREIGRRGGLATQRRQSHATSRTTLRPVPRMASGEHRVSDGEGHRQDDDDARNRDAKREPRSSSGEGG